MPDQPEEQHGDDLLPVDSKAEWADALALYAELIPVLGGAVSNVLGGWSQERRMGRVKEVLVDLSSRIKAQGIELKEDYVRSDEFEDLLDRTLRHVTTERHRSKRQLYAAFLAGAVANPGQPPYDEQLRMLRTIDALQPDHMRLIRAMLQEPAREESGRYRSESGSILATLHRRLPEISRERLVDLAGQLTDELRLVTIGQGLQAMMTAAGAEDLRPRFTPYGQRLVAYIRAVDEKKVETERDG